MISRQPRLETIAALMVDGDAHDARLLQQMLRGFSLASVSVAVTGAQALAELREGHFGLCIIEADLPDMTVTSLVRRIRALEPPQRAIPVLVLTGHASLKGIAAARDAGAHLVLRKPLSPRILLERIRWALTASRLFVDSSRYAGPDRRFRFAGPPFGLERRHPA